MEMTPFHCSNCNKLLGKIDGMAEIKCPRCKTLNLWVAYGEGGTPSDLWGVGVVEKLIPLQRDLNKNNT